MTEKSTSISSFISEKSRADALAVVATAEKIAQREIEQANRRSATRLQAAAAELKAYVESESAVGRARVTAEASQQKLRRRQELVESLLSEALRGLTETPRDDRYIERLCGLACDAARALGSTEAVMLCCVKDRDFLKWEWRFGRVMDTVKNSTGVTLHLSDETAEMSGGFILRTTDGRIAYYSTFEEIAYRRRSELRAIIAGDLFR